MAPGVLSWTVMDAGNVFLVLLIAVIYLLPTWVAMGRETKNAFGVFMANVFFGWTGVVWVAVFLWACLDKQDEGPQKACPFCAEKIKQLANICRFCGKEQPQAPKLPEKPPSVVRGQIGVPPLMPYKEDAYEQWRREQEAQAE